MVYLPLPESSLLELVTPSKLTTINGGFLYTLHGCSMKWKYMPVQFNFQNIIFPCNKMVLNTATDNISILSYSISNFFI